MNVTRLKLRLARIVATLGRPAGADPAAFATLRGVSAEGLDSEDGVRRVLVPWQAITRITAATGQQAYDMTPVLTIDSVAGRTIFLPENEACWAILQGYLPRHLPRALPEGAWLPRLGRSRRGDPHPLTRKQKKAGASPHRPKVVRRRNDVGGERAARPDLDQL